jgi:CRP/FNR family transcriptional regulator, cyclic AMP receptor protein
MTPRSRPAAPSLQGELPQSFEDFNLRLSDNVVRSLTAVGKRRHWRSGQTVVNYGSQVQHVSVCLSGSFRVTINSIDGHSQLLRFMTSGEMFGVPSALAGAPFPTDLVCEQDGDILEVGQQPLEQALRTEPDLALAMIKNLSTRVIELFNFMEASMLPSLRARVYQRLVRLTKLNGQFDRSGFAYLKLTQDDIAMAVNASRPKVHAELKRMEREGIVRLGYRSITLLKPLS